MRNTGAMTGARTAWAEWTEAGAEGQAPLYHDTRACPKRDRKTYLKGISHAMLRGVPQCALR